jgi:hypothetical protein
MIKQNHSGFLTKTNHIDGLEGRGLIYQSDIIY